MSKYGIIMSWAVIGQGGHGHVNNMANEDVIKVNKQSTCTVHRV